jgi:drug/metabolite transporter (DMT)-like permease
LDRKALPYTLLLGALFGTSLIASRFSVGQLNPVTFAGLRMSLASLGYLTYYLLRIGGRRWPTGRRLWRNAGLLGVFDTAVPMVCILVSLQFQSTGVTSILLSIGPAITVLMAHFSLADERLNPSKIIGVGLALGGAALLGLLGESGLREVERFNPLGYLLVLGGMTSASAATIYSRRYMTGCDTSEVASIRMWVAALVVMPLSILMVGFDLGRVTVPGYLAIGYASSAGAFVAFWLVFYNVKRFGATAAAMTLYIVPVVATLGGALVLGEEITSGMLGGMALIVCGIAILNLPGRAVISSRPL